MPLSLLIGLFIVGCIVNILIRANYSQDDDFEDFLNTLGEISNQEQE